MLFGEIYKHFNIPEKRTILYAMRGLDSNTIYWKDKDLKYKRILDTADYNAMAFIDVENILNKLAETGERYMLAYDENENRHNVSVRELTNKIKKYAYNLYP